VEEEEEEEEEGGRGETENLGTEQEKRNRMLMIL